MGINTHTSRVALVYAILCFAICLLAVLLFGRSQQPQNAVSASAFRESSDAAQSGCDINVYNYSQFKDWSWIRNGNGWVLDTQDNVLLKSTDAGASWTRLPLPAKHIISICFVSDLKGWALDYNARVWSSSDGGQSWEASDSPAFSDGADSNPRRVRFFNEEKGIVVGAFDVRYSTDGGKSWSASDLDIDDDSELGTVFADTSGSVWLSGWGCTLFHSTDLGRTWSAVKFEQKGDSSLTSLFFLDNRGWVLSDTLSAAYYSGDGGKTWSRLPTPWKMSRTSLDSFKSIWFQSPEVGYIAGGSQEKMLTEYQGYILKTQDGGKSWRSLKTSDFTGPYFAVVFHDDTNGWVLSRSSILYTRDGGESWNEARIMES